MNYKSLYDNFILYCKNTEPEYRMLKRNVNDFRKGNEKLYTEIHHITPGSIGGGNDDTNLVILLPEEHLFAHKLRYKAYQDRCDFLAVRVTINGLLNHNRYKDIPDNISRKIKASYSWMKQNCSEFRIVHGWQTKDGKKRISESRKNTFPVKCAKTGKMIGSFDKNHPKILAGEWIHHSTGMHKFYNKRTAETIYCSVDDERVLLEEWVGLKYAADGINNSNYSGLTNDVILERCTEVYLNYGVWTYTITRHYCKLKYNESIPKSFCGSYRTPVKIKNIKKYIIETYNAKQECFGTFAKHKTKKILEEITNEFND